MSSLSPWERDSLKGKVTIEERVGYDKKTHGHEFPLPLGEGRVRGLFPGVGERLTPMDKPMPHNRVE
jgi:hypothetical protein